MTPSQRLSNRRGAAVVVGSAAIIGVAVGFLVGEFADLSVYRYGGSAVLDGAAPYDARDPATGYPFTYPPIAAVLMVPLALVPDVVAAALWTGASAACLTAGLLLVARAAGWDVRPWLVGLLACGSLALEPVWQNLTFGQINTLVMFAVLLDLLRPGRRTAGVLVGLAAAVKLTPLIFVVFLVLIGRGRAAARALATFALAAVLGLVVMPGAAVEYWTHRLFDPSRVGPPELAHNQSVSGMLARILGAPSTEGWLLVAVPVTLATLVVAVVWWRRGDELLAVGLAAMAMLLASPVTWSHHWVWAVVVAVALWQRTRLGAVAWTAVFVARPMLWPPWGEGRELAWQWHQHVVGNGYVLAALGFVLLAGAAARHGKPEIPPAPTVEPSGPSTRERERRG